MRRTKGPYNRSTRGREGDLKALLARELTIDQAADALGISQDGLNSWCRRHGKMELYNLFPKREARREKKKYNGA